MEERGTGHCTNDQSLVVDFPNGGVSLGMTGSCDLGNSEKNTDVSCEHLTIVLTIGASNPSVLKGHVSGESQHSLLSIAS
jgi:hypothetical protein